MIAARISLDDEGTNCLANRTTNEDSGADAEGQRILNVISNIANLSIRRLGHRQRER
jgi:hypothetical protein